jgi:hypothetical protein
MNTEIIHYRYVRPDGTVLYTWIVTSQTDLGGFAKWPDGRIRLGMDQWISPPWQLQRKTQDTDWATIDDSALRATMTHIAAIDVTWNDGNGLRLRQRCAWCGATLIDQQIALPSALIVPGHNAGGPIQPTVWKTGALVTIDGDQARNVGHLTEGRPLPDDACTRIDPAVTT